MINQTIVMVTHDMQIAERADKIYKMDNGVLTLYKENNKDDSNEL